MKKLAYFLLGLSIFLFVLSVLFYIFSNKSLDSEMIYASVNISFAGVGFDLNESALTFGKINIGNSVTRSVRVDNSFDFPVFVYISADGNISSLLLYENRVKIEKGSFVLIPFVVKVPSGTNIDFYSGNVSVETKII